MQRAVIRKRFRRVFLATCGPARSNTDHWAVNLVGCTCSAASVHMTGTYTVHVVFLIIIIICSNKSNPVQHVVDDSLLDIPCSCSR